MLNPKKMIPALAAGTLALTGCGGDNGGSNGTGGSGGTGGTGGGTIDGLTEALNAWCMKIVDCFPSDYDNVQDCVNYISEYYGLDDATEACEAAAISYLECGSMLSCDQLDMVSNDCDDEFEDAGVACF